MALRTNVCLCAQGCVSIVDGERDELCENVEFVSNFPHTQMQQNMEICEVDTAAEGGGRRCKYVGTKIGEALRWVEDRDLLTMMLVFMCNTLVFVFSVSLRSKQTDFRQTEADRLSAQMDRANATNVPSIMVGRGLALQCSSARGRGVVCLHSVHSRASVSAETLHQNCRLFKMMH